MFVQMTATVNKQTPPDWHEYFLFTRWRTSSHRMTSSLYATPHRHFRLDLATAIHNQKWLKITHIWLILDQSFTNHDV